MIFKYFAFNSPSGERIKLPLIPITVCCNKQREDIFALVDSGSHCCVFSYSIARLLDIDVYKGKSVGLSGLVGGETKGYLHQVHIEIEGLPSIDPQVIFTETEQPIMPLLGPR